MEEGVCAMLIKQIHSELEKNANNGLRGNDLTMSQISALMELDKAGEGQLELKALEEILHIAKPTAFGIVKRLEEKGFATSARSALDKRVRVVKITPLGRACCHRAKQYMLRTEAALTASLTATEKGILIALLQKVRDSF